MGLEAKRIQDVSFGILGLAEPALKTSQADESSATKAVQLAKSGAPLPLSQDIVGDSRDFRRA
jgi:hypothetical protein